MAFGCAQPQRDQCWLHRLLSRRHESLAQLRQINLIAQRLAESCQDFLRVILVAVEAPVNKILDTRAQGLECTGYCQRGSNNDYTVCLADESTQEKLQLDTDELVYFPNVGDIGKIDGILAEVEKLSWHLCSPF